MSRRTLQLVMGFPFAFEKSNPRAFAASADGTGATSPPAPGVMADHDCWPSIGKMVNKKLPRLRDERKEALLFELFQAPWFS
jgi:hypothetical protein